jgi:ABC-2 type transport system permease protein
MKQLAAVVRKELAGYFGSPLALIFLAAFVGVTLFLFFWVEAFFARGVADVRPLFKWMPLLLIFLVAALTMRQWSEEQRSGTLEMLMTLPVSPWALVLGKFFAVMIMVSVALALTLPLTFSVALLGNLDWGPVIGGYLAALLLAAAYAALGLLISALTDSQIVALILTALGGGALYLVGAGAVTDFFPGPVGNLLRNIGTGSRFQSIERGVIDLRDLLYYITLAASFLVLNVWVIERKRWSDGDATAAYRRNATLLTWLAVANLLLVNVWMAQLTGLRADLTEQREYSLSPATRDLLGALQEPLLIRAYISERSHPLLNPLRPRVEDLLREYEIAGGGRVTAEVVDPLSDPTLEAEATQSYNIQPTPFQVAGRTEASIINAYFDILVRYGDQDLVLNFRDLIDVQADRAGAVSVQLRNPEYDLTSAVKKVTLGFQSVESVLAEIDEPVTLTLYVTPNTLPAELDGAQTVIDEVAGEIAADAGGKFIYQVVNPDDPTAAITRDQLVAMGLDPFPVDLFGAQSYYLHMVLESGDRSQVIYPTGAVTPGVLRSDIEAALKRTSGGFLKTVGLWTPPESPTVDMFGQQQPPLATFQFLAEQLASEYSVERVDLSSGLPPDNIDALVMMMPENLSDRERFAVDQYLMRGGALIVAAGNLRTVIDQSGALALTPVMGGLREMLAHYGLQVGDGVVMDPQNIPFPQPVTRDVGGTLVQEVQYIDFPFFADIRADGMPSKSGITAGLASVTMPWSSPLAVDEGANAGRTVERLLHATSGAWVTENLALQPDFETNPETGYAVEEPTAEQLLALSVTGAFPSYFAGRPSPLREPDPEADPAAPLPAPGVLPATIAESPESARIVLFGSSELANDYVLQVVAQAIGDAALSNVQVIQNAVDWATEDADLLTIRGRGAGVRLLEPLSPGQQTGWEVGNYVAALLLVLLVGGWFLLRRHSEQPMELES